MSYSPSAAFQHQFFILLFDICWSVDDNFSAEAEHPGIEYCPGTTSVSTRKFFHVIGVGGDVLAELVQDRIHQIVCTDEIHGRVFGSEHPEACLKMLLEIQNLPGREEHLLPQQEAIFSLSFADGNNVGLIIGIRIRIGSIYSGKSQSEP